MTRKIYVILFCVISFGSYAQNSVKLNKIVTTKNNKMGVISTSGAVLIDTIYDGVSLFFNKGRKTLPPTEKISREAVELYLVINNNEYAVFDKNGLKVFGFEACFQVEVDEHTQTVVKIVKDSLNYLRSYIFNYNNQMLFDTSFENIGFINHSDLIALIVEDGSNDIFYLYNPFNKLKIGPFSHFNIYNADSSPPLGVKEEHFKKYRLLNFIAVRKSVKGGYLWGVVDLNGKELLPMEYKKLVLLGESTKEMIVDRALSKPEGVEFLFYGYSSNDSSEDNLFLFDAKLNKYAYDGNLRSITLIK